MLLALDALLRIDPARVSPVRLHVVDQEQLRLAAGRAQQVVQRVSALQQACGINSQVSSEGQTDNKASSPPEAACEMSADEHAVVCWTMNGANNAV